MDLIMGNYFAIKKVFGVISMVCILINTSCMLAPPYTKPRINIPQKWPSGNHIKISDNINLPDMHWWKQFQSPELNELIQKALQQNNNLNLAITKINDAQSQLEEIKLNWLPGLSLASGYSQFPVLANPGAFIIATPLYVLNIFQLYKQQQSAQEHLKASYYAKDSARLMIISQVSASFFTLLAQQDELRLYENLLKHDRLQLTLDRSKYGSGLISQDEIDELQSLSEQVESQIDVIKHNIVVSKNTLRFLLNENPGDIIVKTVFTNIDTNKLIPGNLPVIVLNNRPDVHEAEARLKAANADVGAVWANLLPSITLGAYLGKGSYINGPINLLESYVDTPIVNLPVFAQVGASKAKYSAACIHYVDTIRRALRDVDNDLSAYTAYSNQLRTNTSALIHKKRHCQRSMQRYYHGIDNNLDVIQCQIKIDRLELILNKNKLEKMLAIIKLYQDLAGGYRGN